MMNTSSLPGTSGSPWLFGKLRAAHGVRLKTGVKDRKLFNTLGWISPRLLALCSIHHMQRRYLMDSQDAAIDGELDEGKATLIGTT
jgi:hypothetical protein